MSCISFRISRVFMFITVNGVRDVVLVFFREGGVCYGNRCLRVVGFVFFTIEDEDFVVFLEIFGD